MHTTSPAHDALQTAMWNALRAARAMGPNRTGIEASLRHALEGALDCCDALPAPLAPGFRFTKCPPASASGLDAPSAPCHAPPPDMLPPGTHWTPPAFCGGVASMVAARRPLLDTPEGLDD